jgi:hypothetical protein
MATQVFPILRVPDSKILGFFEELVKRYGFTYQSLLVTGSDANVPLNDGLIDRLKTGTTYSLSTVQAVRNNQATIRFERNIDQNRLLADRITLTNNSNALTYLDAATLDQFIQSQFPRLDAGSILAGDPETLRNIISSHQQIVVRLEESLEQISRKFAEEGLRLRKESDDFHRKTQEEFDKKEQELKQVFSAKEVLLAEREKRIDDRDHIHARREIRKDIKGQLEALSKEFKLTRDTRVLRTPIHAVVIGSLGLLCVGIWLFSQGVNPSNPQTYFLLIKPGLMTIAALGLLTWYIRWLNRWFDQHADAEFYLKQFSLDVERASWVVESAMEWNADPDTGGMPDILLKSFTHNLFARTNNVQRDEMHPADYLVSALMGNASRAKWKIGDAELDFGKSALKRGAKAVAPGDAS